MSNYTSEFSSNSNLEYYYSDTGSNQDNNSSNNGDLPVLNNNNNMNDFSLLDISAVSDRTSWEKFVSNEEIIREKLENLKNEYEKTFS